MAELYAGEPEPPLDPEMITRVAMRTDLEEHLLHMKGLLTALSYIAIAEPASRTDIDTAAFQAVWAIKEELERHRDAIATEFGFNDA